LIEPFIGWTLIAIGAIGIIFLMLVLFYGRTSGARDLQRPTYNGVHYILHHVGSQEHYPERKEEVSNLVDHARTELNLIGEEPEVIEGYLKVIQAFADMGHSGGSASVAIPVINELLQFKNLKPLTNNPNEWYQHDPKMWDGVNPIWQNKRNSEAFSQDGGKTYYLLSENKSSSNPEKVYTAVDAN
jgi:hypothetical protein